MKTLGKLILINLVSLMLISTQVTAFDIDNGKALHDENCMRCHNESLYTSEHSKMMNYENLHQRIIQCELMAELAWFEEEIDDVTAYLNQEFYKFEMKK